LLEIIQQYRRLRKAPAATKQGLIPKDMLPKDEWLDGSAAFSVLPLCEEHSFLFRFLSAKEVNKTEKNVVWFYRLGT